MTASSYLNGQVTQDHPTRIKKSSSGCVEGFAVTGAICSAVLFFTALATFTILAVAGRCSQCYYSEQMEGARIMRYLTAAQITSSSMPLVQYNAHYPDGHQALIKHFWSPTCGEFEGVVRKQCTYTALVHPMDQMINNVFRGMDVEFKEKFYQPRNISVPVTQFMVNNPKLPKYSFKTPMALLATSTVAIPWLIGLLGLLSLSGSRPWALVHIFLAAGTIGMAIAGGIIMQKNMHTLANDLNLIAKESKGLISGVTYNKQFLNTMWATVSFNIPMLATTIVFDLVTLCSPSLWKD